jgi:hypothetical protein
MASLADIRARLAAQDTRTSNNNQSSGLVYPHWKIDEGTQATLRFLPDANPENPFFWAERAMIRLPFAGVKGGDPKETVVQVPCVEMYGENEACPILAEVRPWFKDKSLEDMGRKYWKKRTYVFQGFVQQDPTNETDAPANPIRKFMISPQIFTIIKASLMDPEMEDLPTDYNNGLDFRVTKTSKGGYADYSTSTWSRKESALSEQQLASIESFGLNDLSSWLPPKPNEVELKIIHEMFEASVDGQQYDVEKWGNYYRPWGVDKPAGGSSAPVNVVTPVADVSDVADNPFETPAGATEVVTAPVVATTSKAEDILAQIRARQNA